MTGTARLEPRQLEPDAELRAFLAGLDGDGAVVSFVGVARPTGSDGGSLTSLYLDHYPGATEASVEAIVADAMRRFEISRALVVHRCGAVGPGEPIVFVATASRHRRESFLAADFLMDRLKTDAMFWKREEAAGRAVWIEPGARDRSDRLRWDRS